MVIFHSFVLVFTRGVPQTDSGCVANWTPCDDVRVLRPRLRRSWKRSMWMALEKLNLTSFLEHNGVTWGNQPHPQDIPGQHWIHWLSGVKNHRRLENHHWAASFGLARYPWRELLVTTAINMTLGARMNQQIWLDSCLRLTATCWVSASLSLALKCNCTTSVLCFEMIWCHQCVTNRRVFAHLWFMRFMHEFCSMWAR